MNTEERDAYEDLKEKYDEACGLLRESIELLDWEFGYKASALFEKEVNKFLEK